jgi:predicted nucleotidyltransferase component of viral defense system
MADLNYQNLYQTQDKILKAIFEVTHEFYLTGGTCLNRFYYEKRYSDDLDFFTNNSDLFRQSINTVFDALKESGFDVAKTVDGKDFVRFVVMEHNQPLQIDFVNDRVKRIGLPAQKDGYLIDTIDNILSNKITAVLGRDEPKDIFDIYMIASFEEIDWTKILDFARQKVVFQKEDLLYRLDTFPRTFLKKIKLIDGSFLDAFDDKYPQIVESIKNA